MSATSVLWFDIENKQKDFQVIANRLDNGEDIIGWVVVEQPWYSPKNRWKYYVFYNEYGSGGMCGGAVDLGLTKVEVDPKTIRPFTQMEEVKHDLRHGFIVRLEDVHGREVKTISSLNDVDPTLWLDE